MTQLKFSDQPARQEKIVFQVSEFNQFINQLISTTEFIVEGEISEINVRQNRWVFITLKDPKNEEVLNIFSTYYQIKNNLEFLQVGTLVHASGKAKLYGKSGKFSLYAYQVTPVGDGKLQKAFLALKAKLEAEGLFDTDRKRSLPEYPSRIFLLTAPESRAYSDFIKITKARGFGKIEIYYLPINVQGADAVTSILSAFDYIKANPDQADLVVITRGGGSLEDLQAFNHEEVVKSAFGLPIPLVSAIGHEADVSLIDYVADVRASTPSNAAEIIFPALTEVGQQLDFLTQRLASEINRKLDINWHKFELIKESLLKFLSTPFDKLDNLEIQMKGLIDHYQRRLDWLVDQLPRLSQQLIEKSWYHFEFINQKYNKYQSLLASFNPKAVLDRGFSITTDDKGKVIKQASQVRPDQALMTYLKEGKISSKVTKLYDK